MGVEFVILASNKCFRIKQPTHETAKRWLKANPPRSRVEGKSQVNLPQMPPRRCHLFEVAFAWELTKETIHLPLGCLQGGEVQQRMLGTQPFEGSVTPL
jgi:hypothetical protein